eukprot:scaffold16982_cov158-Skeletonema_marinoi.AAC.2
MAVATTDVDGPLEGEDHDSDSDCVVKTNLASSKRNVPVFSNNAVLGLGRRWEEMKENCIRLKRIDDRLIAHLLGSSHEKNNGSSHEKNNGHERRRKRRMNDE